APAHPTGLCVRCEPSCGRRLDMASDNPPDIVESLNPLEDFRDAPALGVRGTPSADFALLLTWARESLPSAEVPCTCDLMGRVLCLRCSVQALVGRTP